MDEFDAQASANTAWAYAKAEQSDAPLFVVLAMVAERRGGDFSAQELANTVWAYAKAEQADAPFFVDLARVAERRVGDFNAQAVANTAWTYAKAEHCIHGKKTKTHPHGSPGGPPWVPQVWRSTHVFKSASS